METVLIGNSIPLVFYNAHQIPTVMDHGKIVERGNHRELLARDGTYAHLWNLQLQEQEEEEQRLKAVGSGLTSTT